MNNIFVKPSFTKLSDEKKERILSSAIDEFADKGYTGANINTIALKANVSVGSLYKYFENKENLYFYLSHICQEKISTELNNILLKNEGFFDKIEEIIKTIQHVSKKEKNLTKLYARMCTEDIVTLSRKVSCEIEGATSDVYSSLIEDAVKKGEVSNNINPSYSAFFLDNLFMMLQFSYSCDYFKDRLNMFISPDAFNDDLTLREEMIRFIRSALI